MGGHLPRRRSAHGRSQSAGPGASIVEREVLRGRYIQVLLRPACTWAQAASESISTALHFSLHFGYIVWYLLRYSWWLNGLVGA